MKTLLYYAALALAIVSAIYFRVLFKRSFRRHPIASADSSEGFFYSIGANRH